MCAQTPLNEAFGNVYDVTFLLDVPIPVLGKIKFRNLPTEIYLSGHDNRNKLYRSRQPERINTFYIKMFTASIGTHFLGHPVFQKYVRLLPCQKPIAENYMNLLYQNSIGCSHHILQSEVASCALASSNGAILVNIYRNQENGRSCQVFLSSF